MTQAFLSGDVDEDRVERRQRFSARNKNFQQEKTIRTALMRAAEEAGDVNLEALPVGMVVQVYSLYAEVEHGNSTYLCVVRKTLAKVSDTQLVVGDEVRFRAVEAESGGDENTGAPQGVVEQILPRRTVLARSDSFKAIDVHPIVANAQQMLIVASVHQPEVKWGLVDRMIVAAQSGGLRPIVCLNKIDLVREGQASAADEESPDQVLSHYESLNIRTIQASVLQNAGIGEIRNTLTDHTTVLAGHSGVGKSSLIRAVQPSLDLRVGEISRYTNKGRHTTTFARRYPLESGGHVIDTPGVKLFGLWGVTRVNLIDYFPDVESETAPEWRRKSYMRILSSLPIGD